MNPYISRGPVRNPDMFFGRAHELLEIAAFLAGHQSVSIVGPRKIGKTSLLFHLMRPAIWPTLRLDDRRLFVYLDCEVLGEAGHEDIFMQFASEIAAALAERNLPPEPALEAAQAKPTRLSFENAVRKLNQRGLQLALILDEFERLSTNSHLDVNFFNALRSAAGRLQLVFLIASARPLIELTYADHAQEILSSPFFNIFAPLFLGLLPEDEARALIRVPAQDAGTPFPAATEDALYNLVGGHPLALQVACFHAFATSDQDAAERQIIQELTAHFQYYWRNLSPAERDTLQHVEVAAARAASDTSLREILRDLVQKCALVANGPGYRYPSLAWARFVASQRDTTAGLTPAMLEIQTAARPAHFATTSLASGAQLGSYEVLEPIGRGGMAEVYKGRHIRLDRMIAIKLLPAGLAAEADFRDRFEREARAVAALKHPHIVQVFDFGDSSGMYYMIMEYIAGEDLGQHLRGVARIALDQVRLLVRQIAAALDYAHEQGLVHRDVKPSNILLQSASGPGQPAHAFLTDFGIAKILTSNTASTRTGTMIGTLDYISPEQIHASGEVDRRADIYALGVVIYQMLTGQLPFRGDHPGAVVMAHLQQPPPDPRLLIPSLPESVTAAIHRALAKDPDERFRAAGELAAALG